MKMKMREHFIGKYILIFILAFSVTIRSQLYPWQRRQIGPAPRSGYFQNANRPPVGRFSGIYGSSSGRALPPSRGLQNNQRQIISSSNNRRPIVHNVLRTPTTRAAPLRQIRPSIITRVNTPLFVRNNQNFPLNHVTPHPILQNRNVLPHPNNNFHPANPIRSGDSFNRRIQNISPNINHPVSSNNQIRTMPRLATSSRPSLQPPAGYKITYCKIFNSTHQLVTLTPLQQPSPQVIRRVPYSGTRNNYSPIQNNIIPRRQPAKYVMVRTEDYVVCSHPSPTPSTSPVHVQSGRTSVIRPNSVLVPKPALTTVSTLVHKQFIPSAIRTSSHNEQLPRQVPNRASLNTRNSIQTRNRVPYRGQINRSFSNFQNNRNINTNYMANRPFRPGNMPRNLVPKSAFNFKPPVPYLRRNIPHAPISNYFPSNKAGGKNIPLNRKNPTNIFNLPNAFSVLSDTTTELSNLFSDFLKTLQKFQVPTSTPPQLNRNTNTRTSRTQNINRGINLSKGSNVRTNRPKTVTKTTARPRSTTSTKANTTNKPRSTTTTSRPRTQSPPPRRQPAQRRPPPRRRPPPGRRYPPGRRPPPGRRLPPGRRPPPGRRFPPGRRPPPRPVQNERIRLYIPPSLRKEIDSNKDELLKLEEEALEEEEEIVEIEEEKEEEEEEEEEEEAEHNNSTKPSPRRRSVRSKSKPPNLGIKIPRRFRATRSLPFV